MSTEFNIRELRAEHELVVRGVQPSSASGDARLAALAAEPIDWSLVREVTTCHGVTPQVCRRLRRLAEGTVPGAALERLRADASSQALQAVRLARELVRVVRALEQAGIRALPFKGAALAAAAYGDVTLRPCRDVDLLVSASDHPRVAEWLRSEGYELDLTEFTREERRGREYQEPFVHRRKQVCLELHWALQARPWPLDLRLGELLARSWPLELAGGRVPALHWEDQILVLAVHGAKHAFRHLLWICDLAAAVRAAEAAGALDVTMLLVRARQLGCLRMLLVGLLACNALLELDLPDAVMTAAANDPHAAEIAQRLVSELFEDAVPGMDEEQLLVALRERRRDRARFVFFRVRRLFRVYLWPSETDRRYAQLPRAFGFLYPFVRVWRVARRREWRALGDLKRDLRRLVQTALRWN